MSHLNVRLLPLSKLKRRTVVDHLGKCGSPIEISIQGFAWSKRSGDQAHPAGGVGKAYSVGRTGGKSPPSEPALGGLLPDGRPERLPGVTGFSSWLLDSRRGRLLAPRLRLWGFFRAPRFAWGFIGSSGWTSGGKEEPPRASGGGGWGWWHCCPSGCTGPRVAPRRCPVVQ
jgi:hypothetical protein